MTYSDCDPDRPTTPESRLRDALEADGQTTVRRKVLDGYA